MKKILSVLMAILFIISIIPVSQLTVSAATSGYYTYTVSGGKATITAVSNKISGNVTIPSDFSGYTVVAIGDRAFYECDSVTKITVPDSVKSIGDAAFGFCGNLTSVELPSDITSINEGAFSDCEKLVNISIPDSVISIGDLAFANCVSLTAVNIPDSVTSIGDYAFGWCSALKSIKIPDSVNSIGEGTFAFCENLTEVSLSNSIKTVAESTFYYCKKLDKITIHNGVTDIGNSAFEGCSSLTSVTIPNTIESIDSYAFYECNKLADIWYGGSEENAIKIGKYNDCLSRATWHCSMCDSGEHSYSGSCLLGCSVCGWKPINHIYVNACDKACNECEKARTVSDHSYSECFEGYSQGLYGSWNVTTAETRVYTLKASSSYEGTNSIHNIAVFDKQGKEVIFNEKLGGFPLVEGQTYTVKFRYDCEDEINGNVSWIKSKLTDKLFPDTNSGTWYTDAVTYSVGRGLIGGYGNGNFGPADNIQRQDFLVILARLDGVDLSQYNYKHSSFPDVSSKSYYEAAVIWGYENGIVTGYNNGKFGVGDKITREQLVTFLYRYARYKGLNVGYTTAEKNKVKNTYTDYKNVSDYAQAPIIWAVKNGVISGKTSTTIVPGGNALRCEVAQIMYNIYLNDIFK